MPTRAHRGDAHVVLPDYAAAQAYFYEHELTDGFPVIPPTPDLVDAMVSRGGRPRETVIGTVERRPNGLTVEQAAVSAVMAGALPEYFPVILATWDAIFDPAFNASAVLGSSGGTSITAIVSGPYAATIGMNSGHNLLGPGNRANATIGRAVRLGVMNGLGYRPGQLDGAAFGTQARYTAHFAEAPPAPPWLPLRARLGYCASATTVTVAVTDAPRQVSHINSGDAGNVLAMLAAAMCDPSHCSAGRNGAWFIVVLGPEHTMILQQAGLTQGAICAKLAEATRITPEALAAGGMPIGADGFPVGESGRVNPGSDGKFSITTAEKIILVTAGGTGAGWSLVIFGYAPARVFSAVTKDVAIP